MRQFDKYVIIKLVNYKIRFRKRSTTYQHKKWVLDIHRTLAYCKSIRHLVMYMVPHGRFARPRGAGNFYQSAIEF